MMRLLVAALCAAAAAAKSDRNLTKKHKKKAPSGPWPVSDDVARLRAETAHCAPLVPYSGGLLVFTRQRSGSRWFMDTLGARSGKRVQSHMHELSLDPQRKGHKYMAVSPHHEACEQPVPNKLCSCALREVLSEEAERTAATHNHSHERAPGYKYMMNHDELYAKNDATPKLNAVIASVCDLKMPWIIFLRRNVLRRIISAQANKWYIANGTLKAHARTEEAVKKLRHKPTINAATLVPLLRKEESDHGTIVELFRHHCGGEWDVDRRLHFYEDLVESNASSHANWGEVLFELGAADTPNATAIQAAFGGWHRSDQSIIHSATPVLETIANPKEVAAALKGTEFAWMLE